MFKADMLLKDVFLILTFNMSFKNFDSFFNKLTVGIELPNNQAVFVIFLLSVSWNHREQKIDICFRRNEEAIIQKDWHLE